MKRIFKTENLIYLTILGLPLYLVRFNFFGFPTNVLDLLEITVILSWLFAENFKGIQMEEFVKANKIFLISISLILVGFMSSLILNNNPQSGLGIIKSYIILPILFMLAAANTLNEARIKKIYWCFFGSSFAVAVISLVYYLTGQVTFDGRLQGIFNSPNYLAMYLAPGILIASDFINKNKKIYSAALLIILSALYLTYSYAAWLALVLAFGTLSAVKKRVSWKKAVLIAILTASFALLQFKTEKWSSLATLSDRSSFSSRITIWRSAGKIIADNLLWGIGAGNFQDKYLEYQKFYPPYLEWAVPHPHSLYLAFLLQSGMIGIAGFILLLFFWFKKASLRIRNQSDFVINMSVAIMIYILIHGLVDTTYFKNDLAVIFWLNLLVIFKKPKIPLELAEK